MAKAKPKAWRLLTDIQAWDAAPIDSQDRAFEAVFDQLGDTFESLGAELHECAGLSHRSASFRHLRTGAILHLIPGGTFTMGLNKEDMFLGGHGWTEREVTIRRPFLIGRTAVSQEQWDRFEFDDERAFEGPDLPIENVAWEFAQDWLAAAGDSLRLPSETEWEYACRAGSTTYDCFGNSINSEQANFDGELQFGEEGESRDCPVPVDWFYPNAFGLFQMHGNVAEWCQDFWSSPHDDPGPGPVDERPISDESKGHVFRGGTWSSGPVAINSSSREWSPEPFSGVGFRIARSLDPIRG